MSDEPGPYAKRDRLYLVRLYARAVALVGDRCRLCGGTEDLEFAHVRPTPLNGYARGKKARMLDIVKYPNCYARLCQLCHASQDKDHYRNRWKRRLS